MNPINVSTETVLRAVIEGDPYHKQFAPLLDEIDRLRDRLAAVEAERETEIKKLHELWSHEITARVSAERILAAVEAERDWLRDASRSVLDDATKQYGSDKYVVDCKHIWALNDALEDVDYDDATAAEKEVTNEN